MSNRRDTQFLWNPHNRATLLDCVFTVNPQQNIGISGLNGSGRIGSVYMNTSVTPAAANPNPAAGYIVVNLMDNYNRYLGMFSAFTAPTDIAQTTIVAGNVYRIAALGSATAAQWITYGLAASIVPAVGAVFVAAVSTTLAGSATVNLPLGSGIDHIEVIGSPDNMNAGKPISGAQSNSGGQLIMACYAGGVITAPAPSTRIRLGIYMNNSAQGV